MVTIEKLSLNLVLFAIVIAAALGVSIWTETQKTGEIRGVVLDENGNGVAGATVRIREKTLNLIKEGTFTETGPDGIFTFTDMFLIEFFIDAEYGSGDELRYHLYFPGQDFELPDRLVLHPAAGE
jgi:hypothetical protein